MAAKKATRKKVVKKKATSRKVKSSTRARTKKVTKSKTPTKKKALPVMPANRSSSRSVYRPSRTVAIVSLIINILLIPGLGTIIGGKTRAGVWQIMLLCVGLVLSLIMIGVPIVMISWIWALISSIQIMQESV